jgi:hypothetical protein
MKKKGFDYIGEIERRAAKIAPPELLNKLDDLGGEFFTSWKFYHDEQENPDKISNPRILFSFERGGEENSYINISLSDYDDSKSINKPEMIGFYVVKDYFEETRSIFEYMYYLQTAAQELAQDLYDGNI